jgi:hypothetical protein
MSSDARAAVRTAILDLHRVLEVPNAPQRPLKHHVVPKGVLSLPPPDSHDTPSTQLTPPDTFTAAPNQAQIDKHLDTLSRKRTLASLPPSHHPDPKKRKICTCKKCGNESCSGRKEVKLCLNQCRDCGKSACTGRDSKRPTKKCWELA